MPTPVPTVPKFTSLARASFLSSRLTAPKCPSHVHTSVFPQTSQTFNRAKTKRDPLGPAGGRGCRGPVHTPWPGHSYTLNSAAAAFLCRRVFSGHCLPTRWDRTQRPPCSRNRPQSVTDGSWCTHSPAPLALGQRVGAGAWWGGGAPRSLLYSGVPRCCPGCVQQHLL